MHSASFIALRLSTLAVMVLGIGFILLLCLLNLMRGLLDDDDDVNEPPSKQRGGREQTRKKNQ
jgi:hypothetical protein